MKIAKNSGRGEKYITVATNKGKKVVNLAKWVGEALNELKNDQVHRDVLNEHQRLIYFMKSKRDKKDGK